MTILGYLVTITSTVHRVTRDRSEAAFGLVASDSRARARIEWSGMKASTEKRPSKQARMRQKLLELGFIQVSVWCRPATGEKFKKQAAKERAEAGIGVQED